MMFPNPFKLLVSWVLHATADRFGWATTAPRSVMEQREAYCFLCPFYDDGICMKCGCLAFAKQSLALEKCPRGLWDRVFIKK